MENKENTRYEMTLLDLWKVFKKAWLFVALAAIAFGAAAYIYIGYFTVPVYSSTSTFYVFYDDKEQSLGVSVGMAQTMAGSYTDFILDNKVLDKMKNDIPELSGYSYTDVDDWAAVSDEWVKEANKDIVYPEPTVKPKYGLSNFVSAINKLEKATSLDERAQIINRTMICLTDYDKSNVKVQQKVDEFLAYVARYNEDVKALNAAFEEIFSFWIPSPDPF